MSSSVEPEKVGLSRDDPKCAAKTTHFETETSTTIYLTAIPELARILAENVTLTPLPANPEAECVLAKVGKLTTVLETYYENKSIAGRVHRAVVVLKNFLKNYFAIPHPDPYTINGYKIVMEYCNQLNGWLDSILALRIDCRKYCWERCTRYWDILNNLRCFEYRSFGFDLDSARALRDMMADYVCRVDVADWEKKPVTSTGHVIRDAIAYLCDQLVHHIECWPYHKPKPEVPSDDEVDLWELSHEDGLTEDEDEDKPEDEHKDKPKNESEDKPKVSDRIRIWTPPKKKSPEKGTSDHH